MRFSRSAALLALVIVLSGCSSAPPTSFDLNAATPATARVGGKTYRIRLPTTTADLFSQRILVRTADNSLAVLKGAQWADQLPSLVRARLTGTFQNAGVRAVGDDAAVAADYDVQTDIRDFELDAGAKQVKVDLAVKVVSVGGGRVVATHDFKASAPVPSTAPEVVTMALNQQLASVMEEIVGFVVSTR